MAFDDDEEFHTVRCCVKAQEKGSYIWCDRFTFFFVNFRDVFTCFFGVLFSFLLGSFLCDM